MMTCIIDITITKDIRGKKISDEQLIKFQDAYYSQKPIRFNKRKVIVDRLIIDTWQTDDGVFRADVSMREYPC